MNFTRQLLFQNKYYFHPVKIIVRFRKELILTQKVKGVGVLKEGETSGAMLNETDFISFGRHKPCAFNGANE